MTIRLGPFDLFEPLGKGGMARVWRGSHRDLGVAVAIKVMTTEVAHLPMFRAAFQEEVRAVARLRHPGIIVVLDSGLVDETAAAVSGGELVAGSPYLVMELGRGTLQDVQRSSLRFVQQRTILLRLLDALACAHARGVIHRDLKPANVLIVSDGEGPTLKLADFGLAHALDRKGGDIFGESTLSGTPRFVAPEQILGKWRDQGPWTDLYALGCLAHWLASGQAPFDGDTEMVLRAHLEEAPRILPPSEDRPDGFDQWMGRLLAKDPRDRYRRAADAAFGLRSLIGEEPEGVRLTLIYGGIGTTEGPEETELVDETIILPEFDESLLRTRESRTVRNLPPLPEEWAPGPDRRADGALLGAGLGLFGLRPPPMVGRLEERGRLWEALHQVHRSGQPEVVILRGSTGTGKSRVAEWMGERAHEVGAATLVRSFLGPMVSPGEGLSRAASQVLRCDGLGRPEILERVQTFFHASGALQADDLFDALALTELIAETAVAEEGEEEELRRVHFSDARERYGVYARFFQRLALERPLYFFFDDVQWSADVLGFVRFCLKDPEVKAPILFVLTAREEDLPRRLEEAERLELLQDHPSVEVMRLAPLHEGEHLQIVRGLLHLDEALAQDIARRTSGNPLFAVQLVGDWIARGVLVSSPTGYRLRDGEEAELPEELHLLLKQRVDGLLSAVAPGQEEGALQALEIAAALGRSVEAREWHMVCELRGVEPSEDAIDALVMAGLARRSSLGFVFVHDALRESLRRVAEEEHRFRSHHRSCAEVLSRLYPKDRPGLSTRLARHFMEAGLLRQALAPLLEAARQAQDAAEPRRAHRILDWRDEVLDKLEIPEERDERVVGWLRRARVHHQEGDTLIGEMLLHKVEEICRRQPGSLETMSEVHYTRGIVDRDGGDHGAAQAKMDQAREGFRQLGDWVGVAKCTHTLGFLYAWQGEFDAAEASFAESLQYFEARNDVRGIGLCHHGLAMVKNRRGDEVGHLSSLVKAYECFDEAGDRVNLANVMNSLGEVYRFRGDLERAAAHYRWAMNTRRRMGFGGFVPAFNLAQTLIRVDRFEEAAFELHHLLASLPEARRVYRGIVHCALLPCVAHLGQWEYWIDHYSQARKLLDETEFVDKDLPALLERAMEAPGMARRPAERRQAAEFAISQWQRLGKTEDVARVRRAFGVGAD